MKGSKRENIFIKDNIPRDVDAANGDVETFNTLMSWTIANKTTLFGPEG
jgi:hypothetical protein